MDLEKRTNMSWTEARAVIQQHVATDLQQNAGHLEEASFCHVPVLAIFGCSPLGKMLLIHRTGKKSWLVPQVNWLSRIWNWLPVLFHSSTASADFRSQSRWPRQPHCHWGSMTAGSNTTSNGGRPFHQLSLRSCHTRARGHLDDLAVLLAWLQKTNAGRQPAMYQCLELLTLDGSDVTTCGHYSSAHVFMAEKQSRISSFIFRGLVAKWLPVDMSLLKKITSQ